MTSARLPDAYLTITDGGLGILPGGSAGITAKIGVTTKGDLNKIAIISDADQIKDIFGSGILVNGLADSFTGGAKSIYAVRAEADVDGSVGAVTKTAAEGDASTLAVKADSKPLDKYDVIVEIITGGTMNTAVFRYSLDGGNSYSGKITTPAGGSYVLADTGLTLEMTGTFADGTIYKFSTAAPQASVSSVLKAVKVLLDSSLSYECIHICGESSVALWTALDVLAKEAESDYRYMYFECDAPAPEDGKTTDEWVQQLVKYHDDFASTRVGVHAAFGTVVDMLTGRQVERNLGSVIRGYVASIKRQDSPGAVALGALSGVMNIQPADLNPAHILALDKAGYTTVRKYIGQSGVFVTNGRMMSQEGSDYEQEENRRVMDHSCELVRAAALKYVKSGATDEKIKALEAFLTHSLNSQVGDGEITYGYVVIPEGQDVYSTSKLRVKIRIWPVPIMREIEIDIGFENPYLTQEA